MASLNKVLLIGRLGQDPEKRTTPSGHTVVNVSLATTEYSKDQSGNKQERTEWMKLVFWNRTAEIVEQYCRKGSQIYVEGSLRTDEWEDKDGNKRSTTKINCFNVQLLDGKPQQGQQPSSSEYQNPHYSAPNQQNQQQPPPQRGERNHPDDFMEDDIPF